MDAPGAEASNASVACRQGIGRREAEEPIAPPPDVRKMVPAACRGQTPQAARLD
jgi:hypothetical protein